ncbi:hypothetical protein K8R78_04405 [bacterium]|nr:hypothetical protein [bacterium]
MDFHELAAQLLLAAPGRENRDTNLNYGYLTKEQGEAAAYYLEELGLTERGIMQLNSHHSEFRFAAIILTRGEMLIGRFEGDVDRIAEHFRQQDTPPSSAIDQSINIANNTGAVVAHSRLDASPIIINSSVTEQLTKIEQALKEDTSLSSEERQDALFDVETLKNQFQRSKPDTTLLDRILSRLGDIASIGSLIAALGGMF